jgi:DNA polymerase-3 subunit alpha (Gram-positive type)
MQEKMKRFLESIGIADAERFDLDFDLVARDPYERNKVNMHIAKNSPWDYSALEEFQEGLTRATYPIDIRFSYINAPSVYDCLSLFNGWYLSVYHGIPAFKVEMADPQSILVTYTSEAMAKAGIPIIADFRGFLKWLNYSFVLTEVTKVEPEKVVLPEKVVNKIEKKAVKVASAEMSNPNTPKDTSYLGAAEPKKEETHEQVLHNVEDEMTKQMETNLKQMEEDRNRKRVFTRGDYKPIASISEIYSMGMESVDFAAEIFSVETRITRTGKTILSIGFGDPSAGINGKAFSDNRTLTPDVLNSFKIGQRVRVRGAIDTDKFSGDKVIICHFIDLLPAKPLRDDPEPEKRVELHLHTKMSNMDGLADPIDYCNVAKNMGMKAIAVTDHGVVQSFPDAQSAGKKTGLKIIYGCELYMFDLIPTYIYNPCDRPLQTASYCVFDFETTGLSAKYDRLTEFGGAIMQNGMVVKTLDIMINPERHIPEKITAKTHITDEMVAGGDKIDVAVKKIADFMGDMIIVSHNATFDVGFLNAARERLGLEPIKNPVIDTLALSHYLFPEAARHNLGALSRNLGLSSYNDDDAHRADFDAKALADVWLSILGILTKNNHELTHRQLMDLRSENPNIFKHMRAYHTVVLCKNEDGLKDLYRLVSESHITYLAEVPKTPRSLIQQYRKNLLVGSACFNGELFELARTRGKEALKEAMAFYDYIEIQPIENYSYLINVGDVASKEQLITILNDIIEAADELGKPICATGDCHYVNPDDKITRDVYISAKAIGGGRHPLNPPFRDKLPLFDNPDQHFRSTREMLDSFKTWMSEDKAREIVIKNTNMIADQIQVVEPVKDDLFTPNANLPDSAEKIRTLCMTNFQKTYGDNPDPAIKERLERELDGIIGHGYAVTYYIAHCIIKKANQDGYIVGSRGSVGSSFAAHMAEITEVNPLAPHYLCPKCKHLEWSQDPNIKSGFDLPDKACPVCGTKMIADGQNIPFETFLGFNADKVPDIDLNFPPDYQSKAHDYTRVLLGEHNVFRAGTIETVAEKTAFGYVRGYFERIGKNPDEMSTATIAYIASKCQGVKRTTGQHPGGIVVIPKDYNVYDFTAIQHPADDREADWLTTHYDFRSMHDELLKLDLLGHVDPLAMRKMSLLTNIDITTIPMNDKKVLSLFNTPLALGMQKNYLKVETGASGLPEFGTDLAQRMLKEAHPTTFNDLLIISGLAHGTDVWNNNAEDLIQSGTATLQQVIGCRDDIMTYLISMGLPSQVSFQIMEDVRHGKKLKPDYAKLMQAHNVPQYYLDSCNKIHYLFPRAHATAYVMMAVRVGYFKVYYPLEFYAVFFSVRSDDWDIKTMVKGYDSIVAKLEEFKRRGMNRDNPLTPKEENIEKTLQIALEMVERGYKFENIDLYKSLATEFLVDHENKALIPPFHVVDGLGDAAAESIVEARKKGQFLSKEDLLKRATKLNGTNLKDLDDLGVLKGLGDTNQMSLFEFM